MKVEYVNFYGISDIPDEKLKYAVIITRYNGKWLYSRHKERSTWEVPGGHREAGEDILTAAKRELFEETGALSFELSPVCAYSLKRDRDSYGLLYYADIYELGPLPDLEMAETALFDDEPGELTYPGIHTELFLAGVSYCLSKDLDNMKPLS